MNKRKLKVIFIIFVLLIQLISPVVSYAATGEIDIKFNDDNMWYALFDYFQNEMNFGELGVDWNVAGASNIIQLTQSQINDVVILKLPNKNISDISGIEKFKNLATLVMANNNISDISKLSTLTGYNGIFYADLSNNKITDVSALKNKQYLFTNLDNNKISDISMIEQKIKDMIDLSIADGYDEEFINDIFSIRNQQIDYSIKESTIKEDYIYITLPSIFQSSQNNNSVIYTNKSLSGTNVIIQKDANGNYEAKIKASELYSKNPSIEIKGGKADGTSITFHLIDDVSPVLTIQSNATTYVKNDDQLKIVISSTEPLEKRTYSLCSLKLAGSEQDYVTEKAISSNKKEITLTTKVKEGDGNITLTLEKGFANDVDGNQTAKVSKVVAILDNTPPTISSVTKSTTNKTTEPVIIKVTAKDNGSGLAAKAYSFDNGTTWQSSNEKEYKENTSNIVIKVKDSLDNITTYTQTLSITNIDNEGPAIKINNVQVENGSKNYYNKNISSITITDTTGVESIKLYKDGIEDETYPARFLGGNSTIQYDGVYKLITTDTLGNTTIVDFTINRTGPVITISGGLDFTYTDSNGLKYYRTSSVSGYTSNPLEITVNQDNLSGIKEFYYIKDGGIPVNISSIVAPVYLSTTGYYEVTAVDNAGNSTTVKFYIDNTPIFAPTLTGKAGSKEIQSGEWSKGPVTITITPPSTLPLCGIHVYQYRVMGTDTWKSCDGDTIVIDLPDWANLSYEVTIEVRTVSNQGLTNNGNIAEFTVKIDRETPQIVVSATGTQDYKKSHTASVAVTDESGIDYTTLRYMWTTSSSEPSNIKTNGTKFSGYTYEGSNLMIVNGLNTPTGVSGTYYLWIYAKDSVGNEITYCNTELAFNLDNKAPTIKIEGNTYSGDSYIYTNQNVIPVITDEHTSVKTVTLQKLIGTEWVSISGYKLGDEIQAEGTYRIQATDTLGNQSNYVYFIIDRTKPQVSSKGVVLNPDINHYYSEPISVDIYDLYMIESDSTITLKKKTSENGSFVKETFDYRINQIGSTGDGIYQLTITDKAKNTTTLIIYIDSEIPSSPTLTGVKVDSEKTYEFETWTNENVRLSITMPETISGTKLYEKYEVNVNDSGSWMEVAVGQTILVSTQGVTQVKVRGVNNAGTVGSESSVYTIKVDKQAPLVEVTGNATTWTKENVTLNIKVNDNPASGSGVKEVTVNGEKITLTSGSAQYVATQNGTYEIIATDNAGNTTSQIVTVDKIDKVAPKLEVLGNTTEWTNKDITLVLNAEDEISGIKSVKIKNGTKEEIIELVNGVRTYTISENGTYEIIVIDNAENEIKYTIEVTKIDKKAPTIAQITGNPTEWTNGNVTLKVEGATDSLSGLSELAYSFDNGATWQASNEKTYTQNTNEIQIKVRDNAGNVYNAEQIDITKTDKQAPSLNVIGNAESWTKANITLNITVSDNPTNGSGLKEVTINGEKITISSGKGSYTVSENGNYEVIAIDNAGNETKQNVIVDKIDKTGAKIEVFGNPTEWTNKDITLVLNAEDEISGIKSVKIKNGTKENIIELVNGVRTYTISENGTYEIIVIDNAENEIKYTIEVTKIDKQAPTITKITGNPTEWTNGNVTLKVEGAVDSLSGLSELAYSFDNGVTWQASNEKTYTQNTNGIQIKVRDNAGNVYNAEQIDIIKINRQGPTITSDKYYIESVGDISKISENTTVAVFKQNITTNATSIVIKNKDGETLKDTDLVGTGMIMELTLEGQKSTYNLAVTGDINGNGIITITDLSLMLGHLTEKTLLTGIHYKAADMNYDTFITITDLSRIITILSNK